LRRVLSKEVVVRWDTWMPSDESEEELPPAPPPDTAEFRAMEADMEVLC